MRIESYRDQCALEVADLFYQAVYAIDRLVYSDAQKEAWAPTQPDYRTRYERLAIKRSLLAMIDAVATALYRYFGQTVMRQGIAHVYAEVSVVAQACLESLWIRADD